MRFRSFFEECSTKFVVFGSARKRPIGKICNTFHTKTSFFKVRPPARAAGKTKKTIQEFINKELPKTLKSLFSYFLREL